MCARQAALMLLAVGAVAGGCGGSSPSPESFRRDVNRICSHYGRKASVIKPPAGRTAEYLSKTIALLEQMNRALGRLTPPPLEEQRFREFLAVQRQSLREMRQLERFTALNEPKALEALKRQKPRIHIPPAQALEHPTGATLAEAMSIPAVGRYVRGLEALGRAGMATGRKGEWLTKRLGFTACL